MNRQGQLRSSLLLSWSWLTALQACEVLSLSVYPIGPYCSLQCTASHWPAAPIHCHCVVRAFLETLCAEWKKGRWERKKKKKKEEP